MTCRCSVRARRAAATQWRFRVRPRVSEPGSSLRLQARCQWQVAQPRAGRRPCASAPVCIVIPGGRGYWQRQLTTAASSGFILNAHSQSTLLLGATVVADGPGSNASHSTWTVHELVDNRTLIVRASRPSLHRPPSLLVSGLLLVQGRTALSMRWIAFQLVGSESLRATKASSSVT